MKKRLFISINPPEEVKKALSLVKNNLSELPAKWVEKNNIHMTLLFIGHADDDKINEIKVDLKRVVKDIKPFEIEVEKISYAPPGLFPPKMIWAEIAKSETLNQLSEKIGNKDFLPHITLAKINTWQFVKMEPEEIPIINLEEILSFTVRSVELMESKVSRGNVKYELLEKFELNKK